MKHAIFLIKIAIIILVVAIVMRLNGYDNLHPIPVIHTTPGGLHRLVDTFFLCAIALSLVEIHHGLKNNRSGDTPNKEEEKK